MNLHTVCRPLAVAILVGIQGATTGLGESPEGQSSPVEQGPTSIQMVDVGQWVLQLQYAPSEGARLAALERLTQSPVSDAYLHGLLWNVSQTDPSPRVRHHAAVAYEMARTGASGPAAASLSRSPSVPPAPAVTETTKGAPSVATGQHTTKQTSKGHEETPAAKVAAKPEDHRPTRDMVREEKPVAKVEKTPVTNEHEPEAVRAFPASESRRPPGLLSEWFINWPGASRAVPGERPHRKPAAESTTSGSPAPSESSGVAPIRNQAAPSKPRGSWKELLQIGPKPGAAKGATDVSLHRGLRTSTTDGLAQEHTKSPASKSAAKPETASYPTVAMTPAYERTVAIRPASQESQEGKEVLSAGALGQGSTLAGGPVTPAVKSSPASSTLGESTRSVQRSKETISSPVMPPSAPVPAQPQVAAPVSRPAPVVAHPAPRIEPRRSAPVAATPVEMTDPAPRTLRPTSEPQVKTPQTTPAYELPEAILAKHRGTSTRPRDEWRRAADVPADPKERKRYAQTKLAQARALLAEGRLEEAEEIARKVQDLAVDYGRFDDTPHAVLREISKTAVRRTTPLW